ncbi:MutH/Sau3AI family endonuclease [Solibacillus isronensis]|uniref:MutH/Sau3AI family endonuclease n=1 Tax=Solibacillus isronensis TaxID=412383 RepID=UPI0020407EFB|nr:MutH/Sau3AI family endonuclease [Solibacillus isronensis]MCM3723973.1 restriction endonuclease [Solibacillus isronensis]
MALHEFKRNELETIFKNVLNKTLGDVDIKNVFNRTITHPKITGIAGDVVEQSILGYQADSDKNPDLLVDGIPTELKTTGIRNPKKQGEFIYEAKEPMSITAVSPDKITSEEFDTSSFWRKLEHMLLVYYHYDSPVTVKAADYANFFIKGYHFHEFSDEEREILKNDWLIVRDFIHHLQETYENPKAEYPRLSSELRKQLMLIDTAPKWPNAPRFRLKRAAVSTLVQKHFGAQFEELDETYSSFKELDAELHKLTAKYKNKTVRELILELDIDFDLSTGKDVPKGISEQIIIKMFGGTAKKLSKIELFSKVGLVPKTIVQTTTGARTEDTKLFKIDFAEWTDIDTSFEDSFIYNYFSGQQFLCIIFEEPSAKSQLLNNKFIGFKRLVFTEDILENEVKPVREKIRDLVNNYKLVETIEMDKFNKPLINKSTNTVKTSLNFPKSKDHTFFVRGSGTDSTKKPLELNGIRMYSQYLWMKGSVINQMLGEVEYI